MTRTIFNTPVLTPLLGLLARFAFVILGWRIRGKAPDIPKYVIIAVPHTSNWDFVFTLLVAFVFRLEPHILGKKELVAGRFGGVLQWMGIIPVDRGQTSNTVGQAVALFQSEATMVLLISPEGTRSRVRQWKTGFYHIAAGAGVPILLCFVDYARRTGGLGPLFHPTGDIKQDIGDIRAFYSRTIGPLP